MNPQGLTRSAIVQALIGNGVVLGAVLLICQSSGSHDLCALGMSLIGAGLVLFSFCAFNECGMSQQRTHIPGLPGLTLTATLSRQDLRSQSVQRCTSRIPWLTLSLGLPLVVLGGLIWLVGR